MSLYRLMLRRASEGRPIRIGLIGAGRLGKSLLAQALWTPGLHVMAVAETAYDKAAAALKAVGWPAERYAARSPAKAIAERGVWITDNAEDLIAAGGLEVVVEATGLANQGIRHALLAFERGRHVVMANLQADALAGPLMALKARKAQLVYSLAKGMTPAILSDQINRARASGLEVVTAGRGVVFGAHLPTINPSTVWDTLELDPEGPEAQDLNPSALVSLMDGTTAALEMAATANACDLEPPPEGLSFTPCTIGDLSKRMVPKSDGGVVKRVGLVDTVSDTDAKGKSIKDGLGNGTYVVVNTEPACADRIFGRPVKPNAPERFAALWQPERPLGLELPLSVAAAALRGEPTGSPKAFRADVVTYAKKGLDPGQVLDGEGGYTVQGCLMDSDEAIDQGCLPIGFAAHARLKTHIAVGHPIRWFDVDVDPANDESDVLAFRRQMELRFAGRAAKNFK